MHTPFLCANKYHADSIEKQIYGAISTENLLLNAYRQFKTGQDFFIGLDTSYQYCTDKAGLLPIMVCSLNQVGHVVAYGVLTNEDKNAQNYILRNVKEAVEGVVCRWVQAGKTYA